MSKRKRPDASRNLAKGNPSAKGRKQGQKVKKINRPGLSFNMKLTIAMTVFSVLALGGIVYVVNASAPEKEPVEKLLVRSDSHTLNTAEDDTVTLVEFLDFECEACGALYPDIEQLREEYENEFTFVVRYFPMGGHTNAEPAARAVEAAAEQDEFEAMYKMMFETQSQWGESAESQEEVFFGFAEEIGLDMEAFARDFSDEETAKRVQKDVKDGEELGVTGTPTIFVNEERVDQPSFETLRELIDAELAG